MGMREDIEAMQRHADADQLAAHMRGEVASIPVERHPLPIGFYPILPRDRAMLEVLK